MSAETVNPLIEFLELLREALSRDVCWGITLSQPHRKVGENSADATTKLSFRPIELAGERRYQLAERRGTQEFHQNLAAEKVIARVTEELGSRFFQGDLFTDEADFSARIRHDGNGQLSRRRPSKSAPVVDHDRRKKYLIPEGRPCPFLTEIGVMTPAGQVKAAKQAKFRQVNRFLEFVDEILPELPISGPLRVIDFGCGKSYLTFALHYLLTELRSREVEVIGLDLKTDVVNDCQRIADKLECKGLRFQVGDIAGYTPNGHVDLSVSLHACDTATDAAIAQAIGWQAKVILAVPCCQHEVANLMPTEQLPGLLRHGILRERFAALATDALRAEYLETVGYRTQVIEFIDLEHTPKNLLLRAIRNENASKPASRDRYEHLKSQLGLSDFALERFQQPR